MSKIEIKARWSGAVLFSLETESVKLCVEAAVKGGANLRSADLCSADLRGANLSSAKVDGFNLVGNRPCLQIGPIGSREDSLLAFITEAGIRINAGCFRGTLAEFVDAVNETHGNSRHANEYAAAIQMIEAHAAIWTPTEEVKEAA